MTNNSIQRVTLFLNSKLLIHARAQAVVEGQSLTDLVEKALLKYLPKKTVIEKVIMSEYSDPKHLVVPR